MKIGYKTNFNGYISMLRAIQLLIKNKMLNFTELGIYICLIFQADYERRHKRTYGIITRDDKEIANELHYDYSTIYRHRKNLIRKGLLIETPEGYTKVPNFYLFELKYAQLLAKVSASHLHELFAEPKGNLEDLQELVARLQENELKKVNPSNASSNDSLVSSQEDINLDEIEKGIKKQQKQDKPANTIPQVSNRCFACGNTKFWKTKDGAIYCSTCHPPTLEREVIE